MRIVCSQCKRTLGIKQPLSDPTVTHGYCPVCEEEMNKKIDEMEVEE